MCLEAAGTNTTIIEFLTMPPSIQLSSAPSSMPSMIPTAEPTPEPSQFQVQDPSMLPTSKLTPWPTNDASLLPTFTSPTPVQDKLAPEPMHDLILLPTLMPSLSSELSSQLSSSPSDFKSTSKPSQMPSKTSNSNDKIVKTDEKWWPKVDKRKIMCVFSADYKDDIVRANAMFETEDECVEYLSTLLRKHHG